MSVRHFTSKDAKYYRYADRTIFVGDVLDTSNSEHMSVGFYRNQKKGERNERVVRYDEARIVRKGALTVRSSDDAKTERAGKSRFLTKGTAIAYVAAEVDTAVDYVSYPHRMDADM